MEQQTSTSIDFNHNQPTKFLFSLKHNEPPIIIIDEKGFTYKGELIEDAGEVYRLFKEFITQNK